MANQLHWSTAGRVVPNSLVELERVLVLVLVAIVIVEVVAVGRRMQNGGHSAS